MTSRDLTRFRALAETSRPNGDLKDIGYRLAFGAIGWPWLLYSLWGGTRASKDRLLRRIGLGSDALPHLGSWKADTGFLHHIVDAVEALRPATVVELGAGASTLVCAKALETNGGGRLVSFDQHAEFVSATGRWLSDNGVDADVRHAPLTRRVSGWPGRWYDLQDVPARINLIIIDGPPWAVHPYVRGAAETLFDRLAPGGMILLDDASRPGERVVAKRWKARHPDIHFEKPSGGTKGTLIGRKASAQVIAFPRQTQRPLSSWKRAAAILGLMGSGWLAHDVAGPIVKPSQAASFVDAASSSYTASVARRRMASQLESTTLDRREIMSTTGLSLPNLPQNWTVTDVQLYPSGSGLAIALVLKTERRELISLFATKTETPAARSPLLDKRHTQVVAFWEVGSIAYALTGELNSSRMMEMATTLAESQDR